MDQWQEGRSKNLSDAFDKLCKTTYHNPKQSATTFIPHREILPLPLKYPLSLLAMSFVKHKKYCRPPSIRIAPCIYYNDLSRLEYRSL